MYCCDRTGDPLVFLTTKARWQEITFVGLFEGNVKWSVLPHVRARASARWPCSCCSASGCPWSWLVFGALYLIPSLQLGMVGVGRYANECFPPFVGVGQILERWPRRVRVRCLRGVDRRPRAVRVRRGPLRARALTAVRA